jgi:hypothetical protein
MALLDLPEQGSAAFTPRMQTNQRFLFACGTFWAVAGIYRWNMGWNQYKRIVGELENTCMRNEVCWMMGFSFGGYDLAILSGTLDDVTTTNHPSETERLKKLGSMHDTGHCRLLCNRHSRFLKKEGNCIYFSFYHSSRRPSDGDNSNL